MSKSMVEQSLFDEAVRIGNQSVSRANQHMIVSKLLVDAIEQALRFIETGRTTQARDRLRRAAVTAAKLLA